MRTFRPITLALLPLLMLLAACGGAATHNPNEAEQRVERVDARPPEPIRTFTSFDVPLHDYQGQPARAVARNALAPDVSTVIASGAAETPGSLTMTLTVPVPSALVSLHPVSEANIAIVRGVVLERDRGVAGVAQPASSARYYRDPMQGDRFGYIIYSDRATILTHQAYVDLIAGYPHQGSITLAQGWNFLIFTIEHVERLDGSQSVVVSSQPGHPRDLPWYVD